MTSHHPLDWIPDQMIPSSCPPLLPPPHMLRADGGLSSLQGRDHQVQQPIHHRLSPSGLECPQALGGLNSWGRGWASRPGDRGPRSPLCHSRPLGVCSHRAPGPRPPRAPNWKRRPMGPAKEGLLTLKQIACPESNCL